MPTAGDANRQPRSQAVELQQVLLVVALVSLILFWVALLADDAAISPLAFTSLPSGLFILLAVFHVLSAPIGWITSLIRLQGANRGRAVVFGLTAVPVTALMTFGVMLSDALVWRGDFYDWFGMFLLALVGPATLATLLGTALKTTRTFNR